MIIKHGTLILALFFSVAGLNAVSEQRKSMFNAKKTILKKKIETKLLELNSEKLRLGKEKKTEREDLNSTTRGMLYRMEYNFWLSGARRPHYTAMEENLKNLRKVEPLPIAKKYAQVCFLEENLKEVLSSVERRGECVNLDYYDASFEECAKEAVTHIVIPAMEINNPKFSTLLDDYEINQARSRAKDEATNFVMHHIYSLKN